MRKLNTVLLSVATAGVLATSLAACGSSSKSTPSAQSTAPVATIASLSGVSTSVKLDPAFLGALKTLGLAPSTFGTATLDGTTGVISFPITGGNVTLYNKGAVTPYVQGLIHHQGSGLTLTAGSTVVTLSNFTVNPGTSTLLGDVTANGKVAATQTPLFFLDGSTLQPVSKDSSGDAILTGTTVKIEPAAATLLDTTFKTTAVTPYFLVGVATITAK